MANAPTLKLWSVQQGKLVDFIVSIQNNEVIAQNDDEFIKFPGGLTKAGLMKLVKAHNKANEGVKALSEDIVMAELDLAEANEKLLADLSK